MSALEQLTSLLSDRGMSDDEINMLLGKFLEEEAEDYVECVSLVKDMISRKNEPLLS